MAVTVTGFTAPIKLFTKPNEDAGTKDGKHHWHADTE